MSQKAVKYTQYGMNNIRGEGGNVIQVRVIDLKLMHSEPTQTAG